jgi:hypothetical protein
MDRILWIGVAVFVTVFVVNGARTVYLSGVFWRYLQQFHPREWTRIYADRWIANIFLAPLMKGNAAEFFWKSREDFDDPKVGVLRAKVKQAFAITVCSLFAVFFWGLVIGVVIPLFGIR